MTTLKNEVEFAGVGIHSGKPVKMVVKPSKENGIFFYRVDVDKKFPISALYNNVSDTKMRNTTIGEINGAHVQTIEHLMAALFIAGIDSAVIYINGPETPILDGSASVFYEKFVDAGITKGKLKKIIVKRPVIVKASQVRKALPLCQRLKWWFLDLIAGKKNDGFVELKPNDGGLNIFATLIYKEKIIGEQSFGYFFDESKKSKDVFVNDVAKARTFGKYSEWEYLKKHNMARGANENNVIALNNTGDGVLNYLIYPDEFVRHKVIDALGDMFTSGGFINADLVSYKGSHALNNLLLRNLFSNPENYEIID